MDAFDTGNHSWQITTSSTTAQQWFDRGVAWTYAFNHELAIECFQKALKHDPNCAMAHWGIAYAGGPNYNFEWWMMDPATLANSVESGFEHVQAGLALSERISAPESALLNALAKRFPQREPGDNPKSWNDDYAEVMAEVYQRFPEQLDIAALYAEAILNKTPWKMWNIHTGQPAEGAGTAAAQNVLEEALDSPAGRAHPGILHLYIHLMEMSPTPEKALVACDHLRELVPDAGHLIHMSTHIDIQCGAYRDVVHWNQKGIEADLRIAEEQGRMNFYTGYRIHNYRFLVYGAMFLGQYEPAIKAANDIISEVPEELLRQESPPMADFMESNISMRTHVQIRFGRWRDIIAEALPEDQELYCHTTAIQHYAKSVAHSA